ncbi:hypothetical protein [Avibacterium gallinarum]|uniref:Transmembrane protein n=2 Tax=Avibacterium TaxID=292486 RepID=A0A379B070_AVIGA|nr:hypothetical protein [Avibacterium gallinarum]TDP29220.1 hypothetical protein EV689_103139 [Avibacterium gallinarum]SUB28280.1 Uncharacterised protein [Avibacterium gallinarum]VGM95829.1 Uncharacterised protein [uncultured Avibacterium sp.]
MQEISLKKITLFWTVVVLLNAALCFFCGLMVSHHPMSILGMLAGIGCFIGFYTFLDYKLLIKQQYLCRKALRQGGIIRAFSQLSILLHFSIEFFCGIVALSTLEVLFHGSLPLFVHSFLATLLTGLALSALLALFGLICFIMLKLRAKANYQ